MEEIQKYGKTVDDAINEALKELNIKRKDAEVIIIDEGSKGILGIFGAKNALVKVKKKINYEKIAETFIKEMLLAIGIVVKVETRLVERKLFIELSGENMGVIIGKRGQTLDSIQYLVNLVVNRNEGQYINVFIDTENYRQRRKETLETLALNLAKKVKSTRKSIVLEPMNPYERRIIHSVLQNDKFVVTHSEGEEPNRNIVITLKNNINKI